MKTHVDFLLSLSVFVDAGAKTRVMNPSDSVTVCLVPYLLQLHAKYTRQGHMPY